MNKLHKLLHYDPDTGEFFWKVSGNGKNVGDRAGSLHHTGYIIIMVNGRNFGAHELAMAYVRGEWPKPTIDHINVNKADNRWENLREATRSQQKMNGSLYKNNTSGNKGVHWYPKKNRWTAYISKDGKRIHLGSFLTREEAASAYTTAAKKLFGEFARPI